MDAINLKQIAVSCRRNVIRMIYDAKSGHVGGSLSSTDILVSLFFDTMRHDPEHPQLRGRDRFILSKGHSVEAYYSVLALSGYFPVEELKSYSTFGSHMIGHPNRGVRGVELSTGALGHGLPVAVGMALAARMDHEDGRVFVLMGDGELAEGSLWEGAMAAGHYKLENLVGIIDRNHLQISGRTEDVMRLEDLAEKWRAFGWEVVTVDGHDFDALRYAFHMRHSGKPLMVIAETVKGRGISFMENKASWHHGVLNEEQYRQALAELDAQMKEAIL